MPYLCIFRRKARIGRILYSRLYSRIMEILREYISPWLVAFGGATFLATFYFSLCQKRLLGAIHQRELNKESKVLEKPWNKTYLLRWNICKSKHSGYLGKSSPISKNLYLHSSGSCISAT